MIGGHKPITLKVSGTSGTVTPDEAIGLGLITSELVINALKHAFPKGEGDVTVTYTAHGKNWVLTISDNGVGIHTSSMANTDGLGTSIVHSLCNQLEADIRRTSTPRGTTISISHPRAVA